MQSILQDVRYGLRQFRKSPGFTAVAVFTLALGIGANTAMFSVLDAVLLRQLPFREPNRLVRGFGKFPANDRASVSPPDFVDLRAQSHSFEQLAAMGTQDGTSNLANGDKPEQVLSDVVSWNFFDALGVRTKIGRSFLPVEEQVNRPQVAILGYSLWQRDFGGDPTVIGRSLNVDGFPMTVVGVLPSDIPLISSAQIWFPMPMLDGGMKHREWHFLGVVGRLRSGVSRADAQNETDAISRALAREYPKSNTDWSLNLVDLREVLVGPVRPALWLLFGAVGLLLLIACANVSNLLLARSTARRKEIAVRAALGASRWRIARQVITESTLLAGAGGTLAMASAFWGVSLLRAMAPADLPRLEEVHVDSSVLIFTAVVSFLIGLLFGSAPALQLSAEDIDQNLKLGGRNSGGLSRHRLGRALMVFEVAISFALLVGAGLLVKSMWRLIHVDPGFRTEHVATARINLSGANYKEENRRAEFIRQLEQRLTNLPGVVSVGAISELPLSGQQNDDYFRIQGREYGPNQTDDADLRVATPGYLKAMGIPLLRGRWFKENDGAQSPMVVVVNEPFVRKYFKDADPLGKVLMIEAGSGAPPSQIVGVVGGVSHFALSEPQPPEMYFAQSQAGVGSMNVVVRATGNPVSLSSAMHEVVAGLDRRESLSAVRPMDDVVQDSIAQPRFSAELLAMFSIVALLLAAVGLYGVVAYLVNQRTHEIGIRISLGAQTSQVMRLIMGEGIRLAAIGSAVGLVAALGLTRLLAGLLYAVAPTDPATLITVCGTLAAVMLLACYLPARRAAQVDPMVALRSE